VAPDEFVQYNVNANCGLLAKVRNFFLRATNGTDSVGVSTKDVLFRKSMKKFHGCPENSLEILGYSKPSFPAALNAETVNLLSSNGIPEDIFVQKQRDYLNYVRRIDYENPQNVVEFLKLMGRFDLIQKLNRQSDENYIPKWI